MFAALRPRLTAALAAVLFCGAAGAEPLALTWTPPVLTEAGAPITGPLRGTLYAECTHLAQTVVVARGFDAGIGSAGVGYWSGQAVPGDCLYTVTTRQQQSAESAPSNAVNAVAAAAQPAPITDLQIGGAP